MREPWPAATKARFLFNFMIDLRIISFPLINLFAEIQMNHKTLQPWLVVLSASLFFFYVFIQMNIFNAIGAPLLQEFHFTASDLGKLSACYFYTNTLLVFPASMLVDRFSTRKILIFSIIACILASYLFATANSFSMMAFARLIVGVAGTFALIPCIKLASRWFPANRIAFLVGLSVTFAMIGGMITQTPMTLFTDAFGWRNTMLFTGGIGVALLALVIVFVRDFPKGKEEFFKAQHAQLKATGFWQSLGKTIANIQNWLAGGYISLLNLPIFFLGATWGTLYLTQAHNLSRTEASLAVSMLFIGAAIGSPLAGLISDKVGKRRMPMILGAVFSLLIFLILMLTPNLSTSLAVVLFLLLGIITSAQVIGYPVIAELNPLEITATATGIASMLIMGAGMLIPTFGWLMEINWNHKIVDNVPFYSVNDYRLAMGIMAIAFIIGIIAAFFIKETNCRPLNEEEPESSKIANPENVALFEAVTQE